MTSWICRNMVKYVQFDVCGTELDGECGGNAVCILGTAYAERGLHRGALSTPASGNVFTVEHG